MINIPKKNLNKQIQPTKTQKKSKMSQINNWTEMIVSDVDNILEDLNKRGTPKTKKILKTEPHAREYKKKNLQTNLKEQIEEEDVDIKIIKKKKQNILYVEGKGAEIFMRQECHICGSTISKTTNHQCQLNKKEGYKFKQAISGQRILWCCRKGYCLNGKNECKCQNDKLFSANLLSLRNKKIAYLEYKNQINLEPFTNFPLMVYMMKKLMSQQPQAFQEKQIQQFNQTFHSCIRRTGNNEKTIFYSMHEFRKNIRLPETRYQLYQYIGSCVYHVLKKKKISLIEIENITVNGFVDLIGAYSPIQLMEAMGIVKRKIWAIQKKRIQAIKKANISDQLNQYCQIIIAQVLYDRQIVYVPSSLLQHLKINTNRLSGYFFETIPTVIVNCELMENIWNSMNPKDWNKYVNQDEWNKNIANEEQLKRIEKGQQIEIYFPTLKFQVDYTCIGIYQAGYCIDYKTQEISFIRKFKNLRDRMRTCEKQIKQKCKKQRNTRAMQIFSIQTIEQMEVEQKQQVIPYIEQTNEAIHLMQLDYIIKIKNYFLQMRVIGRHFSNSFITIAQLQKYNRYTQNGLFSAKAIVNNWPTVFKRQTYISREEEEYLYISQNDIQFFRIWCFRLMIVKMKLKYRLTCMNMKSIIFHSKKQQKKKLLLFSLSYLTKQDLLRNKDVKITELLRSITFKVSDLINNPLKYEEMLSTFYRSTKIINKVKCFGNKMKVNEFEILGRQYYIGVTKQPQNNHNAIFIDRYKHLISRTVKTSRYTMPTDEEQIINQWALKNQKRFNSLRSIDEVKLMGILKIYQEMSWGEIKNRFGHYTFINDELLKNIILNNSQSLDISLWLSDESLFNKMKRNQFQIDLITSSTKFKTIRKTSNIRNRQMVKYDRGRHIYFAQTEPNQETFEFRHYNIMRTSNELSLAFRFWRDKIKYSPETQDKIKKYTNIWRKEVGQMAAQLNSIEVIPSKRFLQERKKINEDYAINKLDQETKNKKLYINFKREKIARIQTWMLMQGYKLANDFAEQAIKYEQENYEQLYFSIQTSMKNQLDKLQLSIFEIDDIKQRVMNEITIRIKMKNMNYKKKELILKKQKYEERCNEACLKLLQQKKKRIIEELMKDIIFQKTLEIKTQFNLQRITQKKLQTKTRFNKQRNKTLLNFKQNNKCSKCKTSFRCSQNGKYTCSGFLCENANTSMISTIKLNCKPEFYLQQKHEIKTLYKFEKIPTMTQKNNLSYYIYRKYDGCTRLSHQYIWQSQAPQHIKVNIPICRMQKQDIEVAQHFQENFQFLALQMFNTIKHGIGIKAKQGIRKNTFVGYYIGEIVQLNKIEAEKEDSLVNIGWLEDKYYVIRPQEYMNHARFFNGAPQKNKSHNLKHTWIYTSINNKQTIALMLYTKRQINQGQQLRWDYGKHYKL